MSYYLQMMADSITIGFKNSESSIKRGGGYESAITPKSSFSYFFYFYTII